MDKVSGVSDNRDCLVSLKDIWKYFNGVPVLKGVDLTLNSGEIHSLLGGNGSGKSTLMKILSGVYRKNAGSIFLEGNEYNFVNPSDAHESGVYLVPQEPKIFPNLSIEENIIIGTPYAPGSKTREIIKMGEQLGFTENLSRPAGVLSIAAQQLMEILRGLLRNVKILIMDEPTSTLTFKEVESLFIQMRRLKEQKIGIFFISHRINEILEISDRVSVIRDGKFIFSDKTENLDETTLINAMLPENKVFERIVSGSKARLLVDSDNEPVLQTVDFTGEAFNRISFSIKPGEIVGLAGVVGAGRTELAEAIIGIDQNTTGKVLVGGKTLVTRNPELCKEKGLLYVPEDRAAHGIFLDLENLYTVTSSILPDIGRVFLDSRKEQKIGKDYIESFGIKASGTDQIARTLSGGNQQKIVISRAIACDPKVVIFDEPTRGVDAEAREDVYDIVKGLVDSMVGILLISSDLEEVLRLSDRILIMYRGEIIKELSADQATIKNVTSGAFGVLE